MNRQSEPVVAYFSDLDQAHHAIQELQRAGIHWKDVGCAFQTVEHETLPWLSRLVDRIAPLRRLPLLASSLESLGLPAIKQLCLETALAHGGAVVAVYDCDESTARALLQACGGTFPCDAAADAAPSLSRVKLVGRCARAA